MQIRSSTPRRQQSVQSATKAAHQLELHAAALDLLKAGRFAEARAPLSRLLLTLATDDPQRASCLATLALVFAETGSAAASDNAARQALRLNPGLLAVRPFLRAG